VDGQNIRVEYRWAEGDDARLHEFAMQLVDLQVQVIVAQTNPATQAAKQATSSIPIVTVSNDPVASGFVASLARPGGNITGLSTISPEAVAKRLELLREVLPHAERVGVLWNPGNSAKSLDWNTLRETAPRLGLKLESLEVPGSNPDLEAALDAASAVHVDALMALNEPSFSRQAARLADLALAHALPTMQDRSEYVAAGSLMAYGVSTVDLYRHLVTYVDRILKGAKPADLPVERPAKFEFVINLKTARALSISFTPSILQQVTESVGG
jgi:putative ABC transport system substrate-binding protein